MGIVNFPLLLRFFDGFDVVRAGLRTVSIPRVSRVSCVVFWHVFATAKGFAARGFHLSRLQLRRFSHFFIVISSLSLVTRVPRMQAIAFFFTPPPLSSRFLLFWRWLFDAITAEFPFSFFMFPFFPTPGVNLRKPIALVSVDSAFTVGVSAVRFSSSVLRFRCSALTFFLRLRSLTRWRSGSGFSRAASSSHVLDRETGASLNLSYFCIYGSSGWASVMVLPWEYTVAATSYDTDLKLA